MIAFCRAQKVPVFFVTRVYAADGRDVEHTRYEVWAKGGKPLSPNCIRTTCYDAISLDYAVTVLSDCTSSKTPEIQESNLRDMANVGAVIASSKEIIKESERA